MLQNKLSKEAWKKAHLVIEQILSHPFHIDLANGTLQKEKFIRFLHQDAVYLQSFTKAMMILGTKISSDYTAEFIDLGQYCLDGEKIVRDYFVAQNGVLKVEFKPNIANVGYTSHLLNITQNEDVAVGLACVLPCWWVFAHMGEHVKSISVKNNPYESWIVNYTDTKFSNTTKRMVDIFDELADKSSDITKQKMLDTFYISCCYEWHFWNDAYYDNIFDGFIK